MLIRCGITRHRIEEFVPHGVSAISFCDEFSSMFIEAISESFPDYDVEVYTVDYGDESVFIDKSCHLDIYEMKNSVMGCYEWALECVLEKFDGIWY